jgi:hypothetical protein
LNHRAFALRQKVRPATAEARYFKMPMIRSSRSLDRFVACFLFGYDRTPKNYLTNPDLTVLGFQC